MYRQDGLEIWNLTPGIPVYTGAQPIFNIVGNVEKPQTIKKFCYSLNGKAEKSIFFNYLNRQFDRLQRPGDFNIDTIRLEQLKPNNQIIFRVIYKNLTEKTHEINFTRSFYTAKFSKFQLNLDRIHYPEQVGQFIDGEWQLVKDEQGDPCLEINQNNAGYDRIILFGHHQWTHSYEIKARLSITQLTDTMYNLGLLFKWNEHLQGDGTWLPTQWSTGLGYYCSYSPGLRLRFGVDVHWDERGNKIGDYVLQEKPFSPYRYYLGKLFRRLLRKKGHLNPFATQILTNKQYYFRLLVKPQKYALTVWEAGKKEPRPQLIVPYPSDKLPQGSVGIIAHNCGVRVYEYQVTPV